MERWAIRDTTGALHCLFYTKERAEEFLRVQVPEYLAKGYYANKALKLENFYVSEYTQSGRWRGGKIALPRD